MLGPLDIGLDECVRALDGAVHVGFRRKMNNGVDVVGRQQRFHQGLIQDVAVEKFDIGGGFGLTQVGPDTRIGQRIQNNDPVVRMMVQPVVDKVGADKAGTAGDE